MRNLNRLESYALAATAVTASLAASANAAVVSSGPVSIAAPATSAGVYLNVVTGQFGSAPAAVTGWDVNVWSSSNLSFGAGFGGNQAETSYVRLAATATSPNTNIANLASGVLVGAFGSMWFGTGNASATAPAGFAFNLNSSNNWVGFRFVNEATGSFHFGYMRLNIGASLTSRTIIEYGYESVAGAPILVPAPGAIALLGAAGLVGSRRRRA